MKKKKNAFTLAEVLITLTIIGVVSSLTIPALMSNASASKNKASLKKALSVLNQAVKMNYANYGWDFADLESTGYDSYHQMSTHRPNEYTSVTALFNEALSGATVLQYDIKSGTSTDTHYAYSNLINGYGLDYVGYKTADNMIFAFNTAAASCTKSDYDHYEGNNSFLQGLYDAGCVGFIDVNGSAPPNRQITCGDTGGIYYGDYSEYCKIDKSDAKKDIFPFVFYDQTVELGPQAARLFISR